MVKQELGKLVVPDKVSKVYNMVLLAFDWDSFVCKFWEHHMPCCGLSSSLRIWSFGDIPGPIDALPSFGKAENSCTLLDFTTFIQVGTGLRKYLGKLWNLWNWEGCQWHGQRDFLQGFSEPIPGGWCLQKFQSHSPLSLIMASKNGKMLYTACT